MLAGYAALLAERHLYLHKMVQPRLVVRASEDLLETIIENIIENAISFSPLNGTLRVRLRRHDGLAELIIEDDGPGVDPANLDRIFERYFSQRDGAAAAPPDPAPGRLVAIGGRDGIVTLNRPQTTPAGEETYFCIGLWIVRRNAEAVGGTVTARNLERGGLRITVRLPLGE